MTLRFKIIFASAVVALVASTTTPAGGAPVMASAVEAPQFATYGAAVPGGSTAEFNRAINNGTPVQWARLFYANTVPASLSAWPQAQAASSLGLQLWISLWLDPVSLAKGSFDVALGAFVKTLPPGTRVTLDHEPSTLVKKLTIPVYKAGFEHGSQVIQDAGGGLVLTGPIDVRSNIIRYHFMDTLNPKYVQFIGIDAYDGINGGLPGKSLQTVAAAAFDYARKKFPLVPLGFAEFNSSRTVGRAQWTADALAWGKTVGADLMLQFQATATYNLTDAEQQEIARLITIPLA